MSKNTMYYADADRGVIDTDRTPFETHWDASDPEYAADDAAEQDYYNSGCDTPETVTLAIFERDDEDSLIGVFRVSREYTATFSSTAVCIECGGTEREPFCAKCRKRYCECPAEDGTPWYTREDFGKFLSRTSFRKQVNRCQGAFHGGGTE